MESPQAHFGGVDCGENVCNTVFAEDSCDV